MQCSRDVVRSRVRSALAMPIRDVNTGMWVEQQTYGRTVRGSHRHARGVFVIRWLETRFEKVWITLQWCYLRQRVAKESLHNVE